MNYNCANCGRAFHCDEVISFCPFCGHAYAVAGAGTGMGTQRIVIGSDSERTVQEKYWKQAHSNLYSALQRLRVSLPRFAKERKQEEKIQIPEKYAFEPVRRGEFASLKHCTSLAAFKAKMGVYLSKLNRAYGVCSELLPIAAQNQRRYRERAATWRRAMELGQWTAADLEDEYSIDFAREEDFVNDFCRDLAEVVGSMSPERLQPESEYDPEDIDWLQMFEEEEDEDGDKLPADTPAHRALLDAINRVAPQVLQIVAENSLFVTSAMVDEESEKFDPARAAETLLSLAERDYDPIFGESPEPLLGAFSQAVLDMTAFTNRLPDYEDALRFDPDRKLERLRRELDGIKLRALIATVEKWRAPLDQEIDRIYQHQTENMLDLSNAIEHLAEALGKE